ncbi:centrin, EF-hand protein [Coemansia spiralis]|nr:centrin, EF-hand protein [Coemansia spiralis]
MSGEPYPMRRTRPPLQPASVAPATRGAATPANWPRPASSTAARKIATPASRYASHDTPAPKSVATPAGGGGGIGNLNFAQREQLREIFDRLDQQGRGFISVTALPEIIRVYGIEKPLPDTWAQWKQQVDPDGTGRVGYSRLEEFISLRYDELTQRQEILNAFKLFKPDAADVEGARITLDDLRRISAHLGEHIPEEDLLEMINIADIDGSGSVGFVDFMRIMRKSGLF